ncbi:MAG: hypothetical protein HY687_02175 [Chloroflexi bacterium]|nr:hypothetical protein [Chloroflexota bacterium]
MAYIQAASRPQAGLPQALRGFWGSLGAGVALGLFILLPIALLIARPSISALEFQTWDGTTNSPLVIADLCGDGDHNAPIFFGWYVFDYLPSGGNPTQSRW